MAEAETADPIRGVDHVGLTVPDMAQAVAFFRDALGCVVVHSRGPTPAADPQRSADADRFLVANLGVHSGTRVRGITMARCGHGANIELFEFASPDRSERPPNNADFGGHHLGFYTTDLAAAAERLVRHGARQLGEVKTVTTGPEAGLSWVYFVAPWGLSLELVSYPGGKAYEQDDPEVRLWNPLTPSL